MDYKVLNRPKLPRNKYGNVDDRTVVGNGSSFYSSSSSSTEGSYSEYIDTFTGSTSTSDGAKGLVPAPKCNANEPINNQNDNQKFLKGNGAWTDIPISRYTAENSNEDGIDLTGNLSVSDTLTTQTLNVTGSAHFWELVIDKVKSTGGNLLITPANFIVDYVGNNITYTVDSTVSPFKEYFYDSENITGIDGLEELFNSAEIVSITAKRVYMKNDDGVHNTVNDFVLGDMVRCKTFNLDDGSEINFQNKDYWTMVVGVGVEDYNDEPCKYIDLFYSYSDGNNTYPLGSTISDDTIVGQTDYYITEFTFGYGEMNVEAGDNIVSLGHLWEGDRQGAILISAVDPMDTELTAPAIAQYKGIRTFTSLSPYRTNTLAANGNEFTGQFNVDYNGNYIDINERLNIFSTDLTTGLETVGIHLDGENSTIKLVGSVELRQNSGGDTDTLTVYDSDDIVRVQISPEEIPAKSSISTNINPTTTLSFNNITGQSQPNGTVMTRHTWTEFIWSWDHKYKYYLSDAYYSWTTYKTLGTFDASDKITISNISGSIDSKAYFKGSTYTSNRGSNRQSISSIILYVQWYNTSTGNWENVSSNNITEDCTIVVNDESATFSYSGNLLDNYVLNYSGSYRCRLDIRFNVYAEITFGSSQSDPYFMFSYTFRSGFTLTQPSAAMTRIGANGLLYNTSNAGQYFYSGNDGIEAKWGDVSLTLDTTYGLKTSGILQELNTSSTSISSNCTIADASGITTNTTIYLPDATTYGVGRILTVLGNDYITVNTISSQTIRIVVSENSGTSGYPAKSAAPYSNATTITMTSTYNSSDGETTTWYRYHNPIIKLMSTGTDWIKI